MMDVSAPAQEPKLDPLNSLEFLIGNLSSESTEVGGDKIRRKIRYSWLYDRKFVRAESSRQIGETTTAMTITYLWDAKAATIRAWIISSDGDWSQARVTVEDQGIRLDAEGLTAGGQSVVLTSVLLNTNSGTRTEKWLDMIVDGKKLPSPPPMVWSKSE